MASGTTIANMNIALHFDTSSMNASVSKAQAKAQQTGQNMAASIGGKAMGALKTVGKVAVGTATAITGAVSGLMVTGGFDRALQIENAQKKLKGLGHDSSSVSAIMDNALAAVTDTAYGLDEAASVAASTVAAGVKPGKDLERTLSLVGDAAAIAGTDMQSMGSIFNKVAANGKLSAEEMNQLSDRGIPILQLLAETTGKTTGEVRDMVSAGKIGFAEFQTAIEHGMGGAAKSMGDTFSGALANMKAAFKNLGAQVMKPLMDGLTPAMNSVKAILKGFAADPGYDPSAEMEKIKVALTTGINNTLVALEPVLKGLIPVIVNLLNLLMQMLPSLIARLLPVIINATVQLVQGLVAMLPSFIQQIAAVLPSLITQLIQGIIQLLLIITQPAYLDKLIDAGIELIFALADGILLNLPAILSAMVRVILRLVYVIGSKAPTFIQKGMELVAKIAIGLVRAIPQLIGKIPTLIGKMVTKFKEAGPPKMIQAGKDLIKGLWNGISDMAGWIGNKIKGFGKGVTDKLKSFFGIKSPSRLFRDEIGKQLAAGIGIGFQQEMGEVVNGMNESLPTTLDTDVTANATVGNWAGSLSSIIGEDIEAGYTSQPITVYMENKINSKLDAQAMGQEMMQAIRRAA